ncbi:MAG: peptidylprolyl isomerase [Holophagaceae bacterium]|nr:peptidylprolyl isomerase [Holophagaceae bacterium]
MPSLKKWHSSAAGQVQSALLQGSSPIARSAAIEDLPVAPADLDALTQFTWKDRDLEPQQTLIESYSRWKLPKEKQIEVLKPWLQHPDWACRYLAYQQLLKLDLTTPWPTAPEPNEREKALLAEAERLASAGKPLRLRITYSGKRIVTLRLDPTVAPINVANITMLARKGFFNGRLVPRVVPDFVVQMGSPYDTMDGGPGYSVRCEDSLNWYGPGSVGMALSGKDTGGSQFFITTNATPHLTGKYTRMGEVEDLDRAMKILDDLELGAKIDRVEVLK